MPAVKTIKVKDNPFDLSEFPSFSNSGSIIGMKQKRYGKDALLVRCGAYIYNVSSAPHIWHWAAGNEFHYLGHTFLPVRQFYPNEEDIVSLSKKLSAIGISNYNGGSWNYDVFYQKADVEKVDIFLMDMTTLVVPCSNELMKYNEI